MLRVCHSNRTEALLAALVGNLRAQREQRGPFAPVALVVPNRNVADYVKLGVAQATGIAANIEVSFLRQHLARIGGQEVVGEPGIEGHLLGLLHDEAFVADLAPVRDYLEAAGQAPDAIDRRRCQLAAELAPLFDEYTLSRPQMLAAWGAGRLATPWEATEEWQRALWLAVTGRRGTRPTLPELLARTDTPGGPLHVFGLSYVARGYHTMLATVAKRRDVWVYTLNPCREFWEDVETVGELKKRIKKEGRAALFPARAEAKQLTLGDDPLGLHATGENLALRLWGRPGRENVRLLNQLTDGDFEGRFVQGERGTLLGRLQNDILDRAHSAQPDARADGSLLVLPCPGLRRELEVVAAEIWRLVRQDATLRLNEIAVVVPESRKEAYLSHVSAVFAESHGLPHSVVDLPLSGGHRLGEAAERLIDLPLGAFTRREVLPLVTHPTVMARFPEATAASWVRLAEQLGIVHGLDRRDHEGTYVTRDLHNWDQGLRRLALGALMEDDDTAVTFGADEYLPAEQPPDEEASSLAFGLVVRSLIEDVRFARGDGTPPSRPLPEWLDFMRGLLAAYLVPLDDAEATLLARCQRALEDLTAMDIGAPVSYRVAAELGKRALARLGGSRGQYLATGVTVSSFVPMRAIPFRAVFVLGLGHGLFPRAARRAQLDLREARRQPGDVNPREQDLYMFLETLLCAREKLVLSYVDRDELTGERLAPSSVLLELREVLGGILPQGELKKLFAPPRPPLRRYDDDERLFASPLASRERAAKEMGRSLRAVLPAGVRVDWPALGRALPDATRAELERRLSVYPPPPRPVTAEPERLIVPLAAIRQFLEDPLQGSARFRLKMREAEDEDDLLDRDEEVFSTDAVDGLRILRDSLTRGLLAADPRAWDSVVGQYQALAARAELQGRAPTGLFSLAERTGHEAILRNWLAEIVLFAGADLFGRRLVRFGRAAWEPIAGEVREPIAIDLELPGARVQVELVGRTELLIEPPKGVTGSIVVVNRKPDDAVAMEKRRLRGFLDHLALSAAELSRGAHTTAVVHGEGCDSTGRFRAVTSTRARAYFASIVRDMLTGAIDRDGRPTGVHDYLLPCEAVFGARGKLPVADEVERLRDLYFEANRKFSSVYGPVPEAVDGHEPPPADEAERMAQARFGLYFELREGA